MVGNFGTLRNREDRREVPEGRVSPEGRTLLCRKGVQKGIGGIPKLKFTNFKILSRFSPVLIRRHSLFIVLIHNTILYPEPILILLIKQLICMYIKYEKGELPLGT